MSRKDYVRIAAALKGVRDGYGPHWDPNLFRACDDITKALAHEFALDNPRFDEGRFLAAAGYNTKGAK